MQTADPAYNSLHGLHTIYFGRWLLHRIGGKRISHSGIFKYKQTNKESNRIKQLYVGNKIKRKEGTKEGLIYDFFLQGDPLWSARFLYTNPNAVKDVHYRYIKTITIELVT